MLLAPLQYFKFQYLRSARYTGLQAEIAPKPGLKLASSWASQEHGSLAERADGACQTDGEGCTASEQWAWAPSHENAEDGEWVVIPEAGSEGSLPEFSERKVHVSLPGCQ